MSPSLGSPSLRGGFAGRPRPESSDFSQRDERPKPHTPRGLQNVGNTCYSNAVLQCLLSTALSDALLHAKAATIFRRYSSNHDLLVEGSASAESDEPKDAIESVRRSQRQREKQHKGHFDQKMQDTCEWLTRELTDITRDYVRVSRPSSVKRSKSSTPSLLASWLGGDAPTPSPRKIVVNPGTITRHPDRLSKCLRPYRQEDAHEFLRSLLSTLALNGHNRKLSSLFDGLLESAVTCQTCQHCSLTRDRYMDLSLDIEGVKTLSDALHRFTATELLDGANQVLCESCNVKQTVTKQLRLATAPSVLVCHLKRFAMNQYGRTSRLNNHVRFPLRLEIGDQMSLVNKAKPPPYELVGVLVHKGRTCDSGHYLAYIKSGKEWFKANDSVVAAVDVDTVLSQQAYVLFYEVAEMRKNEGFTTPHAHRQPHPNLTQSQPTLSDDSSVPSRASTSGSEDELDVSWKERDFCSSWISGIFNTAVEDSVFFDSLCCQVTEPTEAAQERNTVAQDDNESAIDSNNPSRFFESRDSGNGNSMPRAGRMCKSNSSGDLTHYTGRAAQAYQASFPAVSTPRTLSFGRQSDPGPTTEVGCPVSSGLNRKRCSSSLKGRNRDGKLPPRPLHSRRHSTMTPRAGSGGQS